MDTEKLMVIVLVIGSSLVLGLGLWQGLVTGCTNLFSSRLVREE